MIQDKKLVIEFTLSDLRTKEYASAPQGSLEVLYVGVDAPDTAQFDWERIGVSRLGRPRAKLFQRAALRFALRHASGDRWVAVCPPPSMVLLLARQAAEADVPLTLWLDESDMLGWFFYLVALANGSHAEAVFLDDGWNILSHHSQQTEEAA